MGDFSFRAVEMLKSVAAVLAEDTRHTRHLLDRYDIATPLVRITSTTRRRRRRGSSTRLCGGESLRAGVRRRNAAALRSGRRLVRAAVEAGVPCRPDSGRVGAARGAGRVGARRRPLHFFRFPYTHRERTARRARRDYDVAAHGRALRVAQSRRPRHWRARATRERRIGRRWWPAK